MRTAFLKTFLDETRLSRFQNSKFDMWVPVAPKLSVDLAGLWVPRVEGEALRKWLSTGRLQQEGKRGITVPRPYQVFETDEDEDLPPLPVPQPTSVVQPALEEVEEFEEFVFVLAAIEETGAAFEVPIDGVDAATFEESFSKFGLIFSAEVLEFSVCLEIGVTVVFGDD